MVNISPTSYDTLSANVENGEGRKKMISRIVVQMVDEWLDAEVDPSYKHQEMAQDWARVAKIGEEMGEAIAELISSTGQNPRKEYDPLAHERMLRELADTAMTAIYAIQHFTKNIGKTEMILHTHQTKMERRLENAGYSVADI
jgi:hypothetical protein